MGLHIKLRKNQSFKVGNNTYTLKRFKKNESLELVRDSTVITIVQDVKVEVEPNVKVHIVGWHGCVAIEVEAPKSIYIQIERISEVYRYIRRSGMSDRGLRGIKLRLFGKWVKVYGGRGSKILHPTLVTVALDKNLVGDIIFPIKNYGIPSHDDLVRNLHNILDTLEDKGEILITCGHGKGRTGLIIGLLIKIAVSEMSENEDWVALTREYYSNGALETKEQEALLESFNVDLVKTWDYQ